MNLTRREPKKGVYTISSVEPKRHTFLAHPGSETLAQPAVATLVPLVLIHRTVATESARVDVILSHAPPKEALTPIAGRRPVMLPRGSVQADRAIGAYTIRAVGATAEL